MEKEAPTNTEFMLMPGETLEVNQQKITLMKISGETITLSHQTVAAGSDNNTLDLS